MSILSSTRTGASYAPVTEQLLISLGWTKYTDVDYRYTSQFTKKMYLQFGRVQYNKKDNYYSCDTSHERVHIANLYELRLLREYLDIVSKMIITEEQANRRRTISEYFKSEEHFRLFREREKQ